MLAEKLGKVTEQIQQTHAQEWEKMVTLLEELVIVEAQIQQAHTKEYKEIEKEYEATLQKVRAKYNKWQTQAYATANKVIVISSDDDNSDENDDRVFHQKL